MDADSPSHSVVIGSRRGSAERSHESEERDTLLLLEDSISTFLVFSLVGKVTACAAQISRNG